ncbi:hypothetical protein ACFFX0_13865 [Citricoccus parietis]|uniref:Uncharacterized protein n=1 Tax=Citricoccus parietis TaxID=592307 RepID=A0ABV5FZV8_9MICC
MDGGFLGGDAHGESIAHDSIVRNRLGAAALPTGQRCAKGWTCASHHRGAGAAPASSLTTDAPQTHHREVEHEGLAVRWYRQAPGTQ